MVFSPPLILYNAHSISLGDFNKIKIKFKKIKTRKDYYSLKAYV